MNLSRLVVYVAAASMISLTLATGPVSLLTIPEPTAAFDEELGTGSVTIEAEATPETVQLRKGTGGQDLYYLEVPDLTVTISNLTGNPLLDYYIVIPEWNYKASGIVPLGSVGTGPYVVSLHRSTFDAERITQQEYAAELHLTVRGDGGERTVFVRPVTVEVTG